MRDKPVSRGLITVLSGTLGAQLIAAAALPILARLYTPGAFGYLALVLAIASLVAPSATLKFETAAMLPDRRQEVAALTWNAFLASVAVCGITGMVLQLGVWWGVGELGGFSALPVWVSIIVLLTATYTVLSQLALRKQLYSLVSRRALVRSSATVGTQVALGFWGKIPDSLMLGAVVGNAFGIASVFRATREFLKFPGWRAVRGIWRTFWRFPLVFTPSQFLNSVGLQAPVIFFAAWFGSELGGQLGMAERIVGIPLAIMGVAVSQVLEAEVSKQLRHRTGGLRRTYMRFSSMLLALGVVVGVGFGLLGALVVPWILGPQWGTAGVMVQAMALTSGVRLVASPLSRFLVLMQRSAANFALDAIRAALMLISMACAVTLNMSPVEAVWLVYSSLTITYIATWLIGYLEVTRHENRAAASAGTVSD